MSARYWGPMPVTEETQMEGWKSVVDSLIDLKYAELEKQGHVLMTWWLPGLRCFGFFEVFWGWEDRWASLRLVAVIQPWLNKSTDLSEFVLILLSSRKAVLQRFKMCRLKTSVWSRVIPRLRTRDNKGPRDYVWILMEWQAKPVLSSLSWSFFRVIQEFWSEMQS